MDEHEKLSRAKQQVEAITGFYVHVTIFILVLTLLVAINVATGGSWWVQWPLFGWGLGILAHAYTVYGHSPTFIRDWKLRKIKELKDKM